MAENLIFAEQELAFASVEELGGAYAHDFESGNQFTMAVGQTYRIVWDGEPWDAVAWDASAYVDDTIGVGNAALLGLSGTNEPFLIAWSPNGTVILSYDAEASHRIAIYQVVEEETFLVVKKSSMKSVADSIRAKAGVEGDLEWPAGYKAAIEGITAGGGGSSDDVRYVTFMSDDGTEELGKIPVATGYDCPTPKFTATKESTAQFHFTHDYWATEPNGATDPNALKAVTEDRVVYATFISVMRSYTITYNDDDGSELNKQTLTYGSMPSYKPEKDGFIFAKWEPALAEVTGDAIYTATWSEKLTFAGATWADIVRVAQDGSAADMFTVGDTKDLVLNYADGTSETVTCTLIGMNDATGKFTMEDGNPCNMAIMTTQPLKDDVQFVTDTSSGVTQQGFDASKLTAAKYLATNAITHLNSDVFPALPEALEQNSRSRTIKLWSVPAGSGLSAVYASAKLLPPLYGDLDWDSDYTNNISTMYKRGETTGSAYWLATYDRTNPSYQKYFLWNEYIKQSGYRGSTNGTGANTEDDAYAKGVVFVICL